MSFLAFYLIWATLILVPPVLGLWPPLKEGRAYNKPTSIHMPDPAKVYGEKWYPVLVQEIVEWYGQWCMAVFLPAVPCYILSLYTPMMVWGPALVLSTIAAHGLRNMDVVARQFEYLGHAAEFAAGNKAGLQSYQDMPDFVNRMILGYKFFMATSREKAMNGVRRWTPVARAITFLTQVWLTNHRRV